MSASTKIVYNGIDLGLIRTIKVEQRAKYDPHNVDVLYTENRFTVQSVISELDDTEDPLAPSEPGESPAATVARIRHMLLSPRKHFKYTATTTGSGEIVLLEAVGSAGQIGAIFGYAGTEANNGPKPISLDIVNVSPRTWVVHYVIDVCVQDCNVSQHFASNRYEQTHEIDEKGMSKYTRIGKVFVRTDMAVTPDGLRELVSPPVPPGFKRSSLYQLSEDGLSMFYRITDNEFFLGPPPGAVEAQGRFSITSAPPGGVLWAQCDISLTGFKKTPKRQLMQMAVAMALNRMAAGGVNRHGPGDQAQPFIMGGSMDEELFENRVNVSLRGMIGNSMPSQGVSQAEQIGAGLAGGMSTGVFGGGLRGAAIDVWNAIPDSEKTKKAKEAEAERKKQQSVYAKQGTQAPGVTIDGFSDCFGVDVQWGPKPAFETIFGIPHPNPDAQICRQDSIVNTGTNGNDQFLVMLAAAFRDPCVADTVFSNTTTSLNGTTRTGPNEDSAVEFGDPIGIMKSSSGQQADLKTHGYSQLLRDFLAGARSAQAIIADRLGLRDSAASEGIGNPALNWIAGRLCQLDRTHEGFTGVGSLTVDRVEILDDIDNAVKKTSDIGWYEDWAVAVTHDTQFNQDVLPATVEGYDAVKVQWANPLRTVTFKWSVVKHRVPPDVPLLLADPNAVIIRHQMSLPNATILAGGTEPSYECRGETTYKMLSERYAEFHYPVPPWLKIPMRRMPGPNFDPNYVLTGGPIGNGQDQVIGEILGQRWSGDAAPPGLPPNP